MNEETILEESPIDSTDPEESTQSTNEESPVDSSPSDETKELTKVNEKLDMNQTELLSVNEKLQQIVDEMTEEPTPEELEKLEQQAQLEQKELQEQEKDSLTYQETTLENAQTEIEILQEISGKLTTLQTTSEEQFAQTQTFHEDSFKHSSDQTYMLIFALAIALGVKIFTQNLMRW